MTGSQAQDERRKRYEALRDVAARMHADFRLTVPVGDDLKAIIANLHATLRAVPTTRLMECYESALLRHEGQYPLTIAEILQSWPEVEQRLKADRQQAPSHLREHSTRCPNCFDFGYCWISNANGETGVHPCTCDKAPAGQWRIKDGWEPVEWLDQRGQWRKVRY